MTESQSDRVTEAKVLKIWVEPQIERLEVDRTLQRSGRGNDGTYNGYIDCSLS